MSSSPDESRTPVAAGASGGGFGACLRLSLQILKRECPEAHLRMCRRLAGRSMAMEVDGERTALAFHGDGVDLQPAEEAVNAAARPAVEIVTTRAAIVDVLVARMTLPAAIRADAIGLKGRAQDLADAHDAVLDYVHGAVRCPSFAPLLNRYLHPPTNCRRIPPPGDGATASIEQTGYLSPVHFGSTVSSADTAERMRWCDAAATGSTDERALRWQPAATPAHAFLDSVLPLP